MWRCIASRPGHTEEVMSDYAEVAILETQCSDSVAGAVAHKPMKDGGLTSVPPQVETEATRSAYVTEYVSEAGRGKVLGENCRHALGSETKMVVSNRLTNVEGVYLQTPLWWDT